MKKKQSEIKIFFQKYFSENEGSTTILIALILAVVLGISVAFINLAKEKAEQGRVDAVMSVAGRSVLSEYCIPLKERYGLLAVDKTSGEISSRLEYYISGNDNSMDIDNLYVTSYIHSFNNYSHLEEEIVEYYMYLAGKNLIAGSSRPLDTSDDKEKFFRTLNNGKIIDMLPSKGIESGNIESSSIAEGFTDTDKMFDKTKKRVIVNEYILNCFSNYMKAVDESTFFRNEVEYIISGKLSDKKNYTSVRNRIILARNIINYAVIMKEPSMMATVRAMASLAGPASSAAVIALAEAWALAESINDMKILEHGGKIPVIKTKSTWAVSIGSVGESISKGYIDNHCSTGMDYEDYLQVMLYFVDNETKILRMQDLMQINIQAVADENFLVKSCATGFIYSVSINGRKYNYEESF